ncbi:MAG: hypothetical protein JKY11_07765 [Alphaproteobacteria bacterium]|nr:hypothetical protein [Alphaproteobacteria bacterium]
MHEAERQRQKMESLGQLAGGVAHELNNMLQPIFFAVDTIQRCAQDDPVIQKSSKKIISCTVKAAEIIEDILAFSRQDTDRLCFLNLESTLRSSIYFAKDLVPKTVEINVTPIPKSDYWAWMNETDMTRICSNILSNAADAMEQRGRLDVSVEYISVLSHNPECDCVIGRVLAPGRYARISIKDYGTGISEEKIKNIFDPFYTTKDIGQGTGLGLSIVYNILKNWNGGVNAKSVLGKGTEFLLYIPIYRAS